MNPVYERRFKLLYSIIDGVPKNKNWHKNQFINTGLCQSTQGVFTPIF